MRVKTFLLSKLNTDIPAQELDDKTWSYFKNIVIQDGAAKLAAGYRKMTGPLALEPSYLIQHQRQGIYNWVYGGPDGIGVFDGGNNYNITPTVYAGAGAGKWTGADLNNLIILNNTIDPPLYWPGATTQPCEPLPGFPAGTTVGWLRGFKYMAIAGNINSPGGSFENQILWSDAVEPGQVPQTWTPAPDNAAGDNILAATPGAIVDAASMRDTMILFKNHSCYLMTLVGGQYIFDFRKFMVTAGILSTNCFTEYRGFIYWASDGDILKSDGHQVHSIAERRVRRTIFNELDAASYETAFMAIWPEEDELWFCYPTNNSTVPNKAAVYNLVDDSWGFRDLPDVSFASKGLVNDTQAPLTWDTIATTWNTEAGRWSDSAISPIADKLIFATKDIDKSLYVVGETNDTSPVIEGVIQKVSMPIEDPYRSNVVNEIWPIFDSPVEGEMQVRVGGQENENQAIKWQPMQTFRGGTDKKLDVDVEGNFISVEFSGVGRGSRLARINGFGLMYRKTGR